MSLKFQYSVHDLYTTSMKLEQDNEEDIYSSITVSHSFSQGLRSKQEAYLEKAAPGAMKQDFPLCLWSPLPSPHHRSLPRTIERIICENQESLNCFDKLRSSPSLSVPLLADEFVLYLICRKSFDSNTVAQSKESNFFLCLYLMPSPHHGSLPRIVERICENQESRNFFDTLRFFPFRVSTCPLGCRIDSLAYLPKSFDTDNTVSHRFKRNESMASKICKRIPEKKNSKIKFHKTHDQDTGIARKRNKHRAKGK